MINPYFLFEIASHTFLVETISLVEILKEYTIYPIPKSPKTILGMTSVRGSIVVLFNLRALLGIETPVPSSALLMIVECNTQKVGLVVDSVDIAQGLEAMQTDQAHPLQQYIVQSFSHNNAQTHLLDLELLLTH